MKVAYIGLGIMGRPCVLNLLKAGHQVAVWARSRERAESLLQAGASWADSPAALAGQAELLITNVSDTADVEQVLLGEQGAVHGAGAGLVCADMSTIAPNGARRIAARLAEAGIDFLDCPVSGGEVGAVNGTLTIMVGARPRRWSARVRPCKRWGRPLPISAPAAPARWPRPATRSLSASASPRWRKS